VSAAGTAEPPVIGFYNTFSFVIEGRVATQPGAEEGPVPLRPVTPGFFATMGIPLQDGRLPNAFDRADAPRVLAVNETFAQRYWPRERAVGKRISFDEHEGPWYEIVGVVGDTRHFGLDQPVEPAIYMPYAQKRWGWMSWMTFMIRAQGDPLDLVPAIRRAIWSLDDRLPIRELALVEDLYAESNARRRFAAILVVTFAGIAVTLALLGVYGVVSYTVAQRRRELGVRKALGAEERRIVLGVLGQGLFVAAGGVAAGLVGAVVLTRLMTSLLFGVRATDPPTFAFTAALLVAVSLAACWIPARHAARVDPMEALRHE
jgi:predicted permease